MNSSNVGHPFDISSFVAFGRVIFTIVGPNSVFFKLKEKKRKKNGNLKIEKKKKIQQPKNLPHRFGRRVLILDLFQC